MEIAKTDPIWLRKLKQANFHRRNRQRYWRTTSEENINWRTTSEENIWKPDGFPEEFYQTFETR